MNTIKLGQTISDDQFRDAIHIAVAPVVSNETLHPGQHVGLVEGSSTEVQTSRPYIGIVDPFLKHAVPPGTRFWLMLYPQTITTLRHEWTHPAFAKAVQRVQSKSERWIQEFADEVGLSYEDLIGGANSWLANEDCLNRGELLEGKTVPDEFWDHFENVIGHAVDNDKKQSFFTCSC